MTKFYAALQRALGRSRRWSAYPSGCRVLKHLDACLWIVEQS